jgi:CRP-like cAMP-binding protein
MPASPPPAGLEVKSRFLEGLRPSEMELVLKRATKRHFSSKSVMTRQGAPADHLCLLWKGRARYFLVTPNGKRILLMWIAPGSIFGGLALREKRATYIVSTEAVHDCTALVWERAAIRALSKRFPVLLENCIEIASEYISWYTDAHGTVTSRTAPERLAQALFNLASTVGQKVPGGVELRVTNEDLASTANITPYTTCRILSQWQRRGLVRKQRGTILLHSADDLLSSLLTKGARHS